MIKKKKYKNNPPLFFLYPQVGIMSKKSQKKKNKTKQKPLKNTQKNQQDIKILFLWWNQKEKLKEQILHPFIMLNN